MDQRISNVAPLITFGFITVAYGVTIYYLFPKGLLTLNFSLILIVLFSILVSMIIGLGILSFNFQGILEIGLTHLLLFWEKKSMRQMIRKNLIAHKRRNKLTAIIYTLTLACVMCLVIFLNLQLSVIDKDEN